jgi:hypothetical protein
MCFSRIKNIKSLTSKNSGTLIVIKNEVKYTICMSIAGHFALGIFFPSLNIEKKNHY